MTRSRFRPAPSRAARLGKHWWHAPHNPAATQYVYESDLRGGLRFTFLAIALEMPEGCYVTEPMLLTPLRQWTGFTDRATAEQLDVLEHELGELTRHRVPGSTKVGYEMVKLQGRLFVPASAWNPERRSGFRRTARRHDDAPGTPGIQNGGPNSPRIPNAVRDSAVLPTTSTPRGTPPPPAALGHSEASGSSDATSVDADVRVQVHELAEWWARQAPKRGHTSRGHWRVTRSTINRVRERDTALELIHVRGYSVEDLKEMAAEMWAVEPDDVPKSDASYIADSDRSIHVLNSMRDYLHGLVALRRASAADVHAGALDQWRRLVERVKASSGMPSEFVDTHLQGCGLSEKDKTSVWLLIPTSGHRDALQSSGLEAALLKAAAEVLPGVRLVPYVSSPLPLSVEEGAATG